MPYYPRADRPELLGYYLSAIIYLLSKTYYGPQILVHFFLRWFILLKNFHLPYQSCDTYRLRKFKSYTSTFYDKSDQSQKWALVYTLMRMNGQEPRLKWADFGSTRPKTQGGMRGSLAKNISSTFPGNWQIKSTTISTSLVMKNAETPKSMLPTKDFYKIFWPLLCVR